MASDSDDQDGWRRMLGLRPGEGAPEPGLPPPLPPHGPPQSGGRLPSPAAAPHPPSAIEALLKHFSWDNLVVLLVGDGIGLSLCIAAGDAALKRDWGPMSAGFGIGLPLMALASSFPVWKRHIALRSRYSVVQIANAGIAFIILAACVYVLGPYILPQPAPPPSANEIAAAVIRALPQTGTFAEAQPKHYQQDRPVTKEATELRAREYVEIHEFLNRKMVTISLASAVLPSFFDASKRNATIEQVKHYGESMTALFDGLREITRRYPFPDLEEEFGTSREIADLRMAVFTPYKDCLDLLLNVPDDAPQGLRNIIADKIGALKSGFASVGTWDTRKTDSLSKRIRGEGQ